MAFDEAKKPVAKENVEPAGLDMKAILFKESIVHYTSLLHAVALLHIRGDWDLNNLRPHKSSDPPPPLVGFHRIPGSRILGNHWFGMLSMLATF